MFAVAISSAWCIVCGAVADPDCQNGSHTRRIGPREHALQLLRRVHIEVCVGVDKVHRARVQVKTPSGEWRGMVGQNETGRPQRILFRSGAERYGRGGSRFTQAAATGGAGTLGAARAIPLDQMQRRATATGASWAIAHGVLSTGETVNLHESEQTGEAPPAQPHVIQHTEFILVREGEVEFLHEVDGQITTEKVGVGGAIYIAPGTRHAVRNSGKTPAAYFVVAIGGDAK